MNTADLPQPARAVPGRGEGGATRPAAQAGAGVQRQRVHVALEVDVYNAAMLAYALAQQAGAHALLATEVATLVSELGMNIVKYAGSGSLTLSLDGGPGGYLEVLAVDEGPGIADPELALTERYSSRGTLGLGLSGVRRMSDQFELQSRPGAGTTVRARRHFGAVRPTLRETAAAPSAPITRDAMRAAPSAARPAGGEWQHALLKRPCFGEVVSGDGALVQDVAQGLLVGVLDVLGHGAPAHMLARHCERWLAAHADADVAGLLAGLHRETRGSLGLAVTLAYLDAQAGSMVVVGVGNTRLFNLSGTGIAVDAQPGMVGGPNMPTLRPVRMQLRPHDTLVLVSDGIAERLDARSLVALRHLDVRRIAQQMLREHAKDDDDVTCLVLRCPA